MTKKKTTKRNSSGKKPKSIQPTGDLKQKVLAILNSDPSKRFNFKQLSIALKARSLPEKNRLQKILVELDQAKVIKKADLE